MTQEPVEEVEPEILKPRKFGGRQPGSGRPKGSPNKIAHQYGPGALKELARIATQGESEATRVAACLGYPGQGLRQGQYKGRWTTALASS
jgi:hypothetical protein